MAELTPMQKQYDDFKRQYPDCLLLFRLGDFYEGFYEDAKTMSKVLGITLTGRGKDENRVPMAGIPHHALKQYLPKLVKAGYKIALAEQTGQPEAGKLVEREVVKVITPGTVIDENILPVFENNYLAVAYFYAKTNVFALAYTDVSTGEFKVAEYRSDLTVAIPRELMLELFRIRPAEVLLSREQAGKLRPELAKFNLQLVEALEFNFNKSHRLLLTSLKLKSLKAFGIEKMTAGVIAAGVLYQYLLDTQKTSLQHITKIIAQGKSEFMTLDEATISSLELIYSLRGNEKNTLFSCLNLCKTAMGQRLLRNWILRPLLKTSSIEHRFNCITEINTIGNAGEIRNLLEDIIDLERLLARLATKSANARDLLFLKNSLESAVEVIRFCEKSKFTELAKYFPKLTELKKVSKIINLLETAIKEDAPLTVTEGGIINPDYHPELKQISEQAKEGKDYIQSLEQNEQKATGVNSLKVRYNSVFGYYIEVSKSNLDKVPKHYIRRQTLVSAERFITEELKKWEEIILGHESKAAELEYRLFGEIRESVLATVKEIQSVTRAITMLDLFTNFAHLASKYQLVRPEVTDDITEVTEFKNSRHLVVEQNMANDFIRNDVKFGQNQQVIILTGPNMSGKSTYIRQVALLFLMTQIGCFVPADFARIVVADRIFTRVGSADNLAEGESTFMVEMNETANILHNATERSLVILDEIGRGTSTYDGLSLAWAIVEYLVKSVKARTMFATHYHELMLLESKFPEVKNYNVEVKETDQEILFMYKIVKGATDRSYGIYVARLAGIPIDIIARSDEILNELEQDRLPDLVDTAVKAIAKNKSRQVDYENQMSFLAYPSDDEIIEAIKAIDLNGLTPVEALLKLKELQEKIEKN